LCLLIWLWHSLSKTWLSPNVIKSELGFHNYNTYRYDRNSKTSNYSRGGSILLTVNRHLINIISLPMLSVPASPVEHFFVPMKINLIYILTVYIYFPPCSNIANYNINYNTISNLLSSLPYLKNVITIGDHNLSKLHWLPSSISFFPIY